MKNFFGRAYNMSQFILQSSLTQMNYSVLHLLVQKYILKKIISGV